MMQVEEEVNGDPEKEKWAEIETEEGVDAEVDPEVVLGIGTEGAADPEAILQILVDLTRDLGLVHRDQDLALARIAEVEAEVSLRAELETFPSLDHPSQNLLCLRIHL